MATKKKRARKRAAGRPAGKIIVGRIGGPVYEAPDDGGDVPTTWLTVAEAGRAIGIRSHVTLRKLVREEGLPVVMVGRRQLTCRKWLDQWLARRAREQAGEDDPT